jgi:hypothetical protein
MNRGKKLQLQKIEVKSFVTLLNEDEKKKILGGSEEPAQLMGTTIIRIFC